MFTVHMETNTIVNKYYENKLLCPHNCKPTFATPPVYWIIEVSSHICFCCFSVVMLISFLESLWHPLASLSYFNSNYCIKNYIRKRFPKLRSLICFPHVVIRRLPWLVWLSELSASLRTKGSLVRFPVREHAWVAGQVPSAGHTRGDHTLMFLSLSFSLPSLLNK